MEGVFTAEEAFFQFLYEFAWAAIQTAPLNTVTLHRLRPRTDTPALTYLEHTQKHSQADTHDK